MITVIRRKLKSRAARGILLWIVLIAIAAGFLLVRIPKGGPGQVSVATVNGYGIPYSTFYLKVKENENIIKYFKSQYGEYADLLLRSMGFNLDPKALAFDQLVKNALMNQKARDLKIHLDGNYITEKIVDNAFIQREFGTIIPQGSMDPKILSYYLRNAGLTLSDFEDIAVEAMKRELVAGLIGGSFYLPEFEIRQKYVLDYLARKYSVLTFDFDSFLKKEQGGEISKTELKKFFDDQNNLSKRYLVPEKRSGVVYTFDSNSYGIAVQEDEIQKYYEDNKVKQFVENPAKIIARRILFKLDGVSDNQEVYKKAKKIYADLIVEPSKFADIAREFSDDKDSAENGGLLEAFSRGERDREFEKAAFLLKSDGDITDVKKTGDGFEIIQRVSRQDAEFESLKKVKSKIRDSILKNKFRRLFTDDMNGTLNGKSFDEKSLGDIAARANKKEDIELAPISEDGESKALFRIRNNIPAFYVEDNKGFVVVLNDLQKKHFPSLSSIEDTVRNDLYEQRASKQIEVVLKKVKKDAAKSSFADLLKKYKNDYSVRIYQTEWVKQSDVDKVNSLRRKGFPVNQILKLEKVGAIADYRGDSVETSDGYVVKLIEIEPINDKEYSEKKTEIKKEIMRDRGLMHQEQFIDFLRKKATIKANKEIIGL